MAKTIDAKSGAVLRTEEFQTRIDTLRETSAT
jgi:hypothetical protein